MKDPISFSISSQMKTGPSQCTVEVEGVDLCSLAVLENREGRASHLLIDSVGRQEMVLRSGMKNCLVEVDFVVIGAGGSYSNKGGGGSGYVDNSTEYLRDGDIISVDFVDKERAFNVKVFDLEIIKSRPGRDGNSTRGKVQLELCFTLIHSLRWRWLLWRRP